MAYPASKTTQSRLRTSKENTNEQKTTDEKTNDQRRTEEMTTKEGPLRPHTVSKPVTLTNAEISEYC